MDILVAIVIVGLIIWGIVAINASAKRQAEEEERKRKKHFQDKYTQETPARRALILQLYHERLDLKEITFILRKADYRGVSGEEITMKEIMDEHAQIQIDKHKGIHEEDEQEQEAEGKPQ